jgi:thioredoxin reductase (NADPH)
MELYDVVIIGSGPAGWTAGIYSARANLKTLVLAGEKWGGQLQLTTLVENFPGFVEGIQGPELMNNMRKQAEKFGVQVKEEFAKNVNFLKMPFEINEYKGRAVIVATGAEFKWLGLPSEQKLIGKGVSACATCDAAFFRGMRVVVVGGGDAAMEEALFLAKFAAEVTIIHRRDELRASKIMQDRVKGHPKISVKLNNEVVEVLGEDKVRGVKLSTGETLAIEGVFVAVGHRPATDFLKDKIELDDKGFVKKVEHKDYKMMTSVEGVFTAGDVHDNKYKQAITAAGYGCEAALEVEKWLTEK